FKCLSHPANACKQIDEPESGPVLLAIAPPRTLDSVIHYLERKPVSRNLTFLPSVNSASGFTRKLHDLFNAHAGFFTQRGKARKCFGMRHARGFLWERFSHYAHFTRTASSGKLNGSAATSAAGARRLRNE